MLQYLTDWTWCNVRKRLNIHSGANTNCFASKLNIVAYYFLANVTFIGLPSSTSNPPKATFAAAASVSSSYSTKAMSRLEGMRRTSRKPGWRWNNSTSWACWIFSGRFWRKRILLGGRNSSGICWPGWIPAPGGKPKTKSLLESPHSDSYANLNERVSTYHAWAEVVQLGQKAEVFSL